MSSVRTCNTWLLAGSSLVIALAAALMMMERTVAYLLGLWMNISTGEYAHGFLVLAISAYLVAMNRKILLEHAPVPEYRALPLVLAASVLWLMSVVVDVNMVQTVALVLVVLGLVWSVLGTRILHILLFPLLFVLFAIPIWFPLSPLLQDLTAEVVFWIVRLIEVPAFKEQNMIVVPAGRLSIEEACSGLRYLLAALTLGTLYAYLSYRSLRARIAVVLISAAAAVVANIIRVFVVVYLGYATDMQHPWVRDHLMLGWYIFGGLIIILLFIDSRLGLHQPHVAGEAVQQQGSLQARCGGKQAARFIIVLLASLLLTSAGPLVAYQVTGADATGDIPAPDIDMPRIQGWNGPLPVEDDWEPVYHGAVDFRSAYIREGRKLTAYIGYYSKQIQGDELINDLNGIGNQAWRPYFPHDHILEPESGSVREQLLRDDTGQRRLVWFWYNVAGHATTSKYMAKLLQLMALVNGRTDSYVVALATESIDETEHGREVLAEFANGMREPLSNAVVEARESRKAQ